MPSLILRDLPEEVCTLCATVNLYALTSGEHTSTAREALERADGVAVPALWRLEVANALAVIVRRGQHLCIT